MRATAIAVSSGNAAPSAQAAPNSSAGRAARAAPGGAVEPLLLDGYAGGAQGRAQALQRGPDQRRPAFAVIGEGILVRENRAMGGDPGAQLGQVAFHS